jgi:hypothetical protein
MFIVSWLRKLFWRRYSRSLKEHPTEFLYHALDRISSEIKARNRSEKPFDDDTQRLYQKQVRILSELQKRRQKIDSK